MSDTDEDLNEILARSNLIYSAEQIAEAIDSIAAQLNERLKDSQPLLLCVMNGGLVFTGHLLTRLSGFPQVDYIHATRYRNKTSGSVLDWRAYPQTDLKDRIVVILDDILDEGITLKEIIAYCYEQGAQQVLSAVLVRKKHLRCVDDVKSDYIGLEVEDKYVFGFGMDYKSQLRHLNGIYALSE